MQGVSPSLHAFAAFVAFATLVLIFMGGLVTSHDAALAVPDWPNSFGYNMFLFPWSRMVGGIFYEHSHRLMGSFVGVLAIILAVWLWRVDPRRWVVRLGFLALLLVIIQGTLGGLRVVLLVKNLAFFHACLAQGIFCLMAAIALFTSGWWVRRGAEIPTLKDWGIRRLTIVATVVIVVQLMLGAAMRHSNSGLAVPDFPTMYGQWIPPMDAASLEAANQTRVWQLGLETVSFGQIAIHIAHRLGSVVVGAAVIALFFLVRRRYAQSRELRRMASTLMVLFIVQFGLGMSVIWSQKAADVATAHVALGALTLMTSLLMTLVAHRVVMPAGARTSSNPLAEGVAA